MKQLRLWMCLFISSSFIYANNVHSQSWKTPKSDSGRTDTAVGTGLTLSEAWSLTVRANPGLAALRHSIDAAGHRVTQAGVRLNPELGVNIEQFSASLPGFSQSEITVVLSQTLELGGKRSARRNVATAEKSRIEREAIISEFDLYLVVKERFYKVLYTQLGYELSRRSTESARELVSSARRMVTAGAALRADEILGQLALDRALLMEGDASAELNVSRMALAASWLDSTPQFDSVSGIFSNISGQWGTPKPNAEVRSDFLFEADSVLMASRLLNAQAQRKPDLTLGGGIRRLEREDATTFVMGVSLPLPFFNRNKGNILAVRAEQEELRARRLQNRNDALSEVRQREARIAQILIQISTVESILIPQQQAASESMRVAYESGRLSYADLLEVERNLIELYSERIELQSQINLEIINLQRLFGLSDDLLLSNEGR